MIPEKGEPDMGLQNLMRTCSWSGSRTAGVGNVGKYKPLDSLLLLLVSVHA